MSLVYCTSDAFVPILILSVNYLSPRMTDSSLAGCVKRVSGAGISCDNSLLSITDCRPRFDVSQREIATSRARYRTTDEFDCC